MVIPSAVERSDKACRHQTLETSLQFLGLKGELVRIRAAQAFELGKLPPDRWHRGEVFARHQRAIGVPLHEPREKSVVSAAQAGWKIGEQLVADL